MINSQHTHTPHLGHHDVVCPVDDNLIDLSWTGLDIVGYIDWLSISLVVWPCGEMRVVPLEGERERGREIE